MNGRRKMAIHLAAAIGATVLMVTILLPAMGQGHTEYEPRPRPSADYEPWETLLLWEFWALVGATMLVVLAFYGWQRRRGESDEVTET